MRRLAAIFMKVVRKILLSEIFNQKHDSDLHCRDETM